MIMNEDGDFGSFPTGKLGWYKSHPAFNTMLLRNEPQIEDTILKKSFIKTFNTGLI